MEFIITGLVTFFGLLLALVISGSSPLLGVVLGIGTLAVLARRIARPPTL